MERPFIAAYRFFKTRRWFLALTLVLVLSVLGYVGSRISLEEDITRMIPGDERVGLLTDIFRSGQLGEEIVIHLESSDSVSNRTDTLKTLATAVAEGLESSSAASSISNIRLRVDEENFGAVYDSLYAYLPFWLEAEDYDSLEKALTPDALHNRVEGAYKALLTPTGFVVRRYFFRDPLSLMVHATGRLQDLRVDENLILDEGFVMSRDRQHLLMFLTPARGGGETRENARLVAVLDSVIQDLIPEPTGPVRISYYGSAPAAVANAQRVRADVALTVTIALVVLSLLIGFYFRRIQFFLALPLPIIFGGATALAILALVRGQVSMISLGIGSVLLGITVDFALHIFTNSRQGQEPEEVIREVTKPILISGLTTLAAFFCLLGVRSPALHDLGIFAGISVLSSAVFSLLILPHFLPEKPLTNGNKSPHLLERLAAFPISKSRPVVLGLFGLSVLMIFFAREVNFQSDLSRFNYQTPKLADAEKRLDSLFQYSLRAVYLYAVAADEQAALRRSEQIQAKVDSLEKAGTIGKSTTASSLLLSDSLQAKKIARWQAFWTNERKAKFKENLRAAAQDFGIRPGAFQPFFNLLDRQYRPVGLRPFSTLKDQYLGALVNDLPEQTAIATVVETPVENKEAVYAAFESEPGVVVFDRQYLVNAFTSLLREDFGVLVTLSLIVVLLILGHAFARIELGVIAFLPVILSWVWTLGMMNLLGLSFNIFNIIIASFIFGLGVDYCIFITHGLQRDYKYGFEGLSTAKTAILLSAITTLIGIGALIFAKHPAIRSIALLSIIGISASVLTAFVFLPAMFRWLVYRTDGQPRLMPMTIGDMIISVYGFTLFLLGVSLLSALILLMQILQIPKGSGQKLAGFLLQQFARFLLWVEFAISKTYLNPQGEDFKKPAIIVSNHQSHLDLLMILSLSPKLIILTKDWVWNNVFYGRIVRYLDFYPVLDRFEEHQEDIGRKLAEGYSVVVFPEGSRSADSRIGRFRKGAFYLARHFETDLVPVLLHGIGHIVNKGENYTRTGDIAVKILPRIPAQAQVHDEPLRTQTRRIRDYMREEYAQLRFELETPRYFRRWIVKNYLYRGAVIEWYLKVKIRMENDYALFDQLAPRRGKIVDLGCGYGFMSYLLALRSDDRQIEAFDLDADKIAVARNCGLKSGRVKFQVGELGKLNIPTGDCFILSDVLHYLRPEEQKQVLEECLQKLNPGGKIIVRDGNADYASRHRGTKFSEWLSTRVMRFNQSRHGRLFFFGQSDLEKMLDGHRVKLEVLDQTRLTSNLVYVITPEPENVTRTAGHE